MLPSNAFAIPLLPGSGGCSDMCGNNSNAAAWPYTPFTTAGRDIVNAAGQKVVFAGVNWPGAAETMLPEGLQYASIKDSVSKVKELGMNVIRLTYAIEMVDDYLSNSPNQSLKNTLINALGQANGTAVLAKILQNNPTFTQDTTRFEVFDAVAEECASQQIWVHLDNHVSKASWCCSHTDGNAWFGDTYFDVERWKRGLGFMAQYASKWKAFTSMSLRNELREATGTSSAQPYTWSTWYQNMVPASATINGNNSAPLIFMSGLNYDVDDSLMSQGSSMGSGLALDVSSLAYSDKIVFELHNYQNNAPDCDYMKPVLYNGGYGSMDLANATFKNHVPVVLTEFGFDQTDGSSGGAYAQCIKEYLSKDIPGGPGGFMQWVFGGGYYIRQGRQDDDETWGMLNHQWSAWRNQTVVDTYNKPFVSAVTSA